MTTRPGTSDVKVLRLRSGNRYLLAVLGTDGLIRPRPYWITEQALAAAGLSPTLWPLVETEVFVESQAFGLSPESIVFVRRNRRRQVMGAVLWCRDRIFPTLFSSLDDAILAAAR